jgi:opacity protein-like surface antigen
MKKLYLSLFMGVVCVVSSFTTFAQNDLKPFKWDLSVGYAMPSGGKGAKGGVLLASEPKYAIMPNLSLGLRMEVALMARAYGYASDGSDLDISVKASGGYLATADYYFTDNYSLRPFAGAGAGLYTLASVDMGSNGEGVGAGSKFGGMIRAGLELSHFRFGIEYNIVPSVKLDGYDQNGDPAKIDSKNSYLGIKLGVCLGGGPR